MADQLNMENTNPPENPVNNPELSEDKKDNATGKQPRKSSALRAAGQWRSAVDHVRAHSHNDVEGSSKLANTGPYIDYEEK